MTVTGNTLYKRTATGAIQVWYQELDGHKWRTVSGQLNGKMVESTWHECEGKNIGRSNETTPIGQAYQEVDSNYALKLRLGYTEDLANIDKVDFFKPMLAKDYDDYSPVKFPVYSQPKLDGVRCIATVDGLWARTGKPILSAPHIHRSLVEYGIFEKFPVIDGELYNHDLKDDFNKIISLVRKTKPEPEDLIESERLVQYHIYDVYDDTLGFEDRWVKFVEHTFINVPEFCQLVLTAESTTQHDLDLMNQMAILDGYEGQMVRASNAKYENKRTKSLLKRKEFDTTEFKIVDITEGVGNRAGMAGRVVCSLPDGRHFEAGIKGSHDFSKQLLLDVEKYRGGTCTVRHFKYTPDGIPRFGVGYAFYDGERDM